MVFWIDPEIHSESCVPNAFNFETFPFLITDDESMNPSGLQPHSENTRGLLSQLRNHEMDFAALVERDRRQHDEVVVQQEIVVEYVLIPFQRYLSCELLRTGLHSDRARLLAKGRRNQGWYTSPDKSHLVVEGASFRPSVNSASIEADFEAPCSPGQHESDVVSGFEPSFTDHRADNSAGSDPRATHVEIVQPLSALRQSLCCQRS